MFASRVANVFPISSRVANAFPISSRASTLSRALKRPILLKTASHYAPCRCFSSSGRLYKSVEHAKPTRSHASVHDASQNNAQETKSAPDNSLLGSLSNLKTPNVIEDHHRTDDPHSPVKSPRHAFPIAEVEAARKARIEGLGWLAHLPAPWVPYAELMRLEKPAGTLLLLAPGYWGVTMAAYGVAAPLAVTLKALALFSAGALVMRGAGCTINDILDRDLDNKVARTCERPLASGRVSVPRAVAWLGVQCFTGLGILLSLPAECLAVGALLVPVFFVYPLFKRFTYYPQAWFALTFSWGCVLGYPAVYAPINWLVAGPLALSNWFWGIAYDTVYAHQDKKYDAQAGIKSVALKWGNDSKRYIYRLVLAQALCFAAAGIFNGMGPAFYICGAWAFQRWVSHVRNVNLDDPADCMRTFKENTVTGFVFWLGMFIDYFVSVTNFF